MSPAGGQHPERGWSSRHLISSRPIDPHLLSRCTDLFRRLSPQALDALDQEAEEDETLRSRYDSTPSSARWTRPASHDVNKHLTGQAESFRSTLEQAGASDAVVRSKWDQWEEQIEVLGGDEVSGPGIFLAASVFFVPDLLFNSVGGSPKFCASPPLGPLPLLHASHPSAPHPSRDPLGPLRCPCAHLRVLQGAHRAGSRSPPR